MKLNKKIITLMLFTYNGRNLLKINVRKKIIYGFFLVLIICGIGIGWLLFSTLQLNVKLADFSLAKKKVHEQQQLLDQFQSEQIELSFHYDNLNNLQSDIEHELTKLSKNTVDISKYVVNDHILEKHISVMDTIPNHIVSLSRDTFDSFLDFMEQGTLSTSSTSIGWPLPLIFNGNAEIKKHATQHTDSHISIAALEGTPVYASENGVVSTVSKEHNGLIEIYHNNGFYTLYQNVTNIQVHQGEVVKQREKIAYIKPIPKHLVSYLIYEENFYGVPFEHFFTFD